MAKRKPWVDLSFEEIKSVAIELHSKVAALDDEKKIERIHRAWQQSGDKEALSFIYMTELIAQLEGKNRFHYRTHARELIKYEPGRPAVFDKKEVISVRLKRSTISKLPAEKSRFIEAAIEEKLQREQRG